MRSWPYYDEVEHGDHYHRPWWQPRVRLTRRGEIVAVILMLLVLFGLMWAASAVGTWATGVPG